MHTPDDDTTDSWPGPATTPTRRKPSPQVAEQVERLQRLLETTAATGWTMTRRRRARKIVKKLRRLGCKVSSDFLHALQHGELEDPMDE